MTDDPITRCPDYYSLKNPPLSPASDPSSGRNTRILKGFTIVNHPRKIFPARPLFLALLYPINIELEPIVVLLR